MPYLRRYGRALTGCQTTGDTLAAKARRSARTMPLPLSARAVRILMFTELHNAWSELRAHSLSQREARRRMGRLTRNSRETLLLRAIEEFSFAEIAKILNLDEAQAEQLFEVALAEAPYKSGTRVLIVEDDPMVAMDMSACLSDMGCQVVGVARTAAEAVELAGNSPPELIIASLLLADKSSGLEAARRITAQNPRTDAVFVTPYPERLLTGTTQEPVFIITTPYLQDQVRSAVTQSFLLSGL
ncbi:response regulator [uncultured Litoreibacter sp.]|nr:response regulator [uncultured Litoreibacter sp.]